MKEILKKIDPKSEVDRIFLLHWSHTFLVFVLALAELSQGHAKSYSIFLIKVAALIAIYRAYYKTITHFYYTFWAFSGLVFVYLLRGFFVHSIQTGDSTLSFLYFCGMAILVIECYIISSPLFFPRVRWWEYDFRYKSELKVEVETGDQLCPGRLTDLRREAGCVVTFTNFRIGDHLIVHVNADGQVHKLKAKIFTSKEYTAGRGITYGVKFSLQEAEDREQFEILRRSWKENKKARLRNRFTKKGTS